METTKKDIKYIEYNLVPVVKAYYGYNILDSFLDILNQYKYDKIFFITEKFIYNLHGKDFIANLEAHNINHEVLLIENTEKDKTFRNVDFICNYLINHKISKDSIIIGFGGGVIGNISGLAAGLIYRGVSYIEIPTTFMGLTDSSLSHKQAVNGDSGKNQIGRYYAPLFIWSDIKYIETEGVRNIKAAIVEGIKNTLIQDKELLEELIFSIIGKKSFDKDELLYLFETIAQSKNRILAVDPTEKAYCIILEYGHTFGHAIEFLTSGKIIHGEAVAIGMCVAAEISFQLGKISKEDVDLHYRILGDLIFRNNKAVKKIKNLTTDAIMQAIQSDNKRTSAGIKYVILDAIGTCAKENGEWQIQVDKELVVSCMKKAFHRILTFEAQEVTEQAIAAYINKKLGTVEAVLDYYFSDKADKKLFQDSYIAHTGIYMGDYEDECFIEEIKAYLENIKGKRISNLEYGPTYISPKYYGTPGWWFSFHLLSDNSEVELFTCRNYGRWSEYSLEKKITLMSHYAIGVKTKENFYKIYDALKENENFEAFVMTDNDVVGHTYAHFKNKETLDVLEIIFTSQKKGSHGNY